LQHILHQLNVVSASVGLQMPHFPTVRQPTVLT
jgi:hypothetical protein